MHLGWDKTLEKLYEYYWFEGMAKYVRKFVENCHACRVSKASSGKIQAETTSDTQDQHTVAYGAHGHNGQAKWQK